MFNSLDGLDGFDGFTFLGELDETIESLDQKLEEYAREMETALEESKGWDSTIESIKNTLDRWDDFLSSDRLKRLGNPSVIAQIQEEISLSSYCSDDDPPEVIEDGIKRYFLDISGRLIDELDIDPEIASNVKNELAAAILEKLASITYKIMQGYDTLLQLLSNGPYPPDVVLNMAESAVKMVLLLFASKRPEDSPFASVVAELSQSLDDVVGKKRTAEVKYKQAKAKYDEIVLEKQRLLRSSGRHAMANILESARGAIEKALEEYDESNGGIEVIYESIHPDHKDEGFDYDDLQNNLVAVIAYNPKDGVHIAPFEEVVEIIVSDYARWKRYVGKQKPASQRKKQGGIDIGSGPWLAYIDFINENGTRVRHEVNLERPRPGEDIDPNHFVLWIWDKNTEHPVVGPIEYTSMRSALLAILGWYVDHDYVRPVAGTNRFVKSAESAPKFWMKATALWNQGKPVLEPKSTESRKSRSAKQPNFSVDDTGEPLDFSTIKVVVPVKVGIVRDSRIMKLARSVAETFISNASDIKNATFPGTAGFYIAASRPPAWHGEDRVMIHLLFNTDSDAGLAIFDSMSSSTKRSKLEHALDILLRRHDVEIEPEDKEAFIDSVREEFPPAKKRLSRS